MTNKLIYKKNTWSDGLRLSLIVLRSSLQTPPFHNIYGHSCSPTYPLLFQNHKSLFYVCCTNSPLISASLVRHSLLHFHLSYMTVLRLHHLHYHRLHLLLLAQYFILNSRLGSSANPFLHRPFPFLPDWFHGLSDHLMILLCSTAGLVCMVC